MEGHPLVSQLETGAEPHRYHDRTDVMPSSEHWAQDIPLTSFPSSQTPAESSEVPSQSVANVRPQDELFSK